MILLDTDHLSVLLDERDRRCQHLWDRLDAADEDLALPIVVIEEQLRAWLSKIHGLRNPHRQIIPYARLARIFILLREWPIVQWTESCADQFQS